MQYAQYGDHYIVRLDEGEEVIGALTRFMVEHDIRAGYFVAWGGFSQLTLKYYQVGERRYKERKLDMQVEVVSLLGNVGYLNGEMIIHAHTTVGDEEFRTYSGHLGHAQVRPLLEVFVTPLPGELRRVQDEERNLSLIEFQEENESDA
jgi:predicted DNA-binding protein with PD1-like motif